jgi:5,10-methylene-tetrahydrofolate dehydrogenase/methenyl tetrahydrofolate cyclohydrolase
MISPFLTAAEPDGARDMIERCYTNDQEVQNVQFDGHTAIVTGAATGIGRAIATCLAESGAAVALVDVDEDGVNVASEKTPFPVEQGGNYRN